MSIDFFNTVESIEKTAKNIKFLDGSFPAVGDKYEQRVANIRSELESLENDLKKELAAHTKAPASKKKRGSKPKAV